MKYFKRTRLGSCIELGKAPVGRPERLAAGAEIRHAVWLVMTTDGLSSVAAALLVCVIGLCGCSTPDPGPSCVTLNTECQPLHDPPTYSTIFSKIFQPSCAIGMTTCHTSDARKLGLYFENPAQAYELLLGMTDGRARVLPNDPGCSILAERILSKDPAFRMPPGNVPLLDGEICDIVKWLADGAKDN